MATCCIIIARAHDTGDKWGIEWQPAVESRYLGHAFEPAELRRNGDFVKEGRRLEALLSDDETALTAKVEYMSALVRRIQEDRIVLCAELRQLETWIPALKAVFLERLRLLHLCDGTLFSAVVERVCREWARLRQQTKSSGTPELEKLISKSWQSALNQREDWERLFFRYGLAVTVVGKQPLLAALASNHGSNHCEENSDREMKATVTAMLSAYLLPIEPIMWRGTPNGTLHEVGT